MIVDFPLVAVSTSLDALIYGDWCREGKHSCVDSFGSICLCFSREFLGRRLLLAMFNLSDLTHIVRDIQVGLMFWLELVRSVKWTWFLSSN
ncbi:hypothetical protein LINGRAHAP2_LOCUS30619 [Linum grandiflorum]